MITPRHDVPDLGLQSDGIDVARFARARGRPLISWQQYAAERIGQYRVIDGARRYAYPVALILVPRQCGKTSLAFDLALGRGLWQQDYRAAYTAQTGTVVSDRMGEQRAELAASVLAPYMLLRASAGTERITNLRTRSYVKAFPPKDGALRGSALDLVLADEAQEHDSALGDALDGTITPTFTTRPRRQLILLGTAGTDQSGYLRRYRDLALAGEPGIALLEFGAGADEDPMDPDVWTRSHPGIGTLTDQDALSTALMTLGPASFAREYLNVWTAGRSWIIDPETLESAWIEPSRPPGRLMLGIDSSPDRDRAAVAAAWRGQDGILTGAILWSGAASGLRTAASRLSAELSAPVSFDHYSAGPAAHGTTWNPIMARDLSAASALILESARESRLRLIRDQELADAILGASTRSVGSGAGFTFTWRSGPGSVNLCPLMALTIATAGLLTQREPLLVV
jgi:phage terminase large subunit-like protein